MLPHLERLHVETSVRVNNRKAGNLMNYCVPHEYDITTLINAGSNNRINTCTTDMPDELKQ
ncbi:MAG: hypothetical protein LBS09_01905 [Bacteroidales bacterium]|nr:hypothetical protein [Bacteroidales bacterium]